MGFFSKLASVGRSIVSGARKVVQKVVTWGAKAAGQIKNAWSRVKPVVSKALEWVKERVREIEVLGVPVGKMVVKGVELLWGQLFGERSDVPVEQEWGERLQAIAAAVARALDSDAVRSDHETYLRLMSAMRIVRTLGDSYVPGDHLTDDQVRALHAVIELVERGDEIDDESLEFLERYARQRFGHSLTVLALESLNTRYFEELEQLREDLFEHEDLEVTYEARLDRIASGAAVEYTAAHVRALLEPLRAERAILQERRRKLQRVVHVMQGLAEFEKVAGEPAHGADPYRAIPRVERRVVRRAMELIPRLDQVGGTLGDLSEDEENDLQRFASLYIMHTHEAQKRFRDDLGGTVVVGV